MSGLLFDPAGLNQTFGQRFVRSQNFSYFDSSVIIGNEVRDEETCSGSDRKPYIIHREHWLYSYWYSWMSLMISYSTIMTAFFLAYDPPGTFMVYVDRLVWLMFVVDFVLEFFVDFKDDNDVLVESLSAIALAYLRGWFILDLLAVIPLSEIGYAKAEYYMRMLRLLKVKRGLSLFDGSFIGPIIISLMKPKRPTEKHKLDMNIRYFISLFQILAALIFTTYVLGAFFFWWAEITEDGLAPQNKHFIDLFPITNPSPLQEMLRSWYFLTTTLSTVGYGDYYATNMPEKVLLIIILLIGISQFSLIVGQFNGLIAEFDKMDDKNKNMDELIAWLASIDAVQNHIPIILRGKILRHFEYYWEHDRLRALALPWWKAETAEELCTHQDQYLSMLPTGHREAILNHLFQDFGLKFGVFFMKNIQFRMDLTPFFQPRLFLANHHVLMKGKIVEEIIFVVKGEVACGIEQGKTFKPVIFFKNSAIVGDVEAIGNKPALASYKVVGTNSVHAYALPVKPVQVLLKGKYKQIYSHLRVQQRLKIEYMSRALEKFSEERIDTESSVFSALKQRQKAKKDKAEYRQVTENDVEQKRTELKELQNQLTLLRLENEAQRNSLIQEILEKAA